MDNNVVRTLNEGPMGPQGPVKVNNCIMNKEAGFEPVVRIYPHTWPEDETTEDEEDTITGGVGGDTVTGGEGGDTITGGDTISGGDTVTGGETNPTVDPVTPTPGTNEGEEGE